MDIEKWLCSLGLQQYVTTFRDNAIDAEVLTELTEADLEKLGVVLGHRKRLLKAIAALASPAGLDQATPLDQTPPIGDGAERGEPGAGNATARGWIRHGRVCAAFDGCRRPSGRTRLDPGTEPNPLFWPEVQFIVGRVERQLWPSASLAMYCEQRDMSGA